MIVDRVRLAMLLSVTAIMAFSTVNVMSDEPVPERRYVYQEDLNRIVGFHTSDGRIHGKLDATGRFVPSPGAKPAVVSSGPLAINGRSKHEEFVYEFRSGMLIKGRFDERLNFVPERGSTIIAFKDYRSSNGAIRIYNLPGKFVEIVDPKAPALALKRNGEHQSKGGRK